TSSLTTPCPWGHQIQKSGEVTAGGPKPFTAAFFTTVDGAEERSYSKLPPLEEAVAAHLCPPSPLGLMAHAVHPSNPCKITSALANRAYAEAAQTGLSLHASILANCKRLSKSCAQQPTWLCVQQKHQY
ncbi:hypothetical protein M9458_045179, partial [Cirrhinus mrigala]